MDAPNPARSLLLFHWNSRGILGKGRSGMNRIALIGLLTIILLLSSLTLVSGGLSGLFVIVAGLFFVAGGTLLTTIISQDFQSVTAVLRELPALFRQQATHDDADQELFLRIAELYRRNAVRTTEMAIKGLNDDFLRQGAQLINDRYERQDLMRVLQWSLSRAKEQDRHRLRVLHSMLGFAPAFGMLGTLLGLLKLLFDLGESGLNEVGIAMGFAMITTVYGLALANLMIKPLLIKMEQQSRHRLAWMMVKYEALLMLYEKQHPALIQEAFEAFSPGHSDNPPAPPSPHATLART